MDSSKSDKKFAGQTEQQLYKQLSDRHQLLLERLFDGECSFFSRFRAESLLKRNQDAKRYFDSLERSAACLWESSEEKEQLFCSSKSEADLWTAIERRIDQEERASLFLGTRVVAGNGDRSQQVKDGFWGSIFGPVSTLSMRKGAIGKGFAGALACSALLVVGVSQYGEELGLSGTPARRTAALNDGAGSEASESGLRTVNQNEPIRITSTMPVPVELVSSRVGNTRARSTGQPLNANTFDRFAFDDLFSSSPQIQFRQPQAPKTVTARQPVFVAQNRPRSVEVDWMRSDGRVRIMNGPNADAPIIFVKKRKPLTYYRQASPSTANIGTGMVINPSAVPTATFSTR